MRRRVRFEYDTVPSKRDEHERVREVRCFLEFLSETTGLWTAQSFGESQCAKGDQFVKETGRRIAIKRAISTLLLRSDRAAYAGLYFKRKERKIPRANPIYSHHILTNII